MITMLLGGLWHGANWKFVIWGGYQGALLCTERLFAGRSLVPPLLRGLFTFALICVGWVFFRADTLHDGGIVISQMFSLHRGTWLLGPAHLLLLTCAAVGARWPMLERVAQGSSWAKVAVIVCGLIVIELFAAGDGIVPFIYFQF